MHKQTSSTSVSGIRLRFFSVEKIITRIKNSCESHPQQIGDIDIRGYGFDIIKPNEHYNNVHPQQNDLDQSKSHHLEIKEEKAPGKV